MSVRHRVGVTALVVTLAASAALAGCSPAAVAPTASGTVVTVTEVEYSLAVSPDVSRPGTYTFEVHNEGGATHNLRITGPGLDDAQTPNIGPDGITSITVTLEKGEYELFCATAGHKEAGMDVTITIP